MDKTLTFAISPVGAGSLSVSPYGTALPPKQMSWPQGTVVTISALSPITGYIFDHWEGNLSGQSSTNVLTMDTDKSITVVYKAVPGIVNYTLTTAVTAGVGTINPSFLVYEGSDSLDPLAAILMQAVPGDGQLFGSWGGDVSDAIPYVGDPLSVIRLPRNKNRYVTASFSTALAPVPKRTLTTNVAAGSGTIMPSYGVYNDLDFITIQAFPGNGYVFSSWSGDIDGTPPSVPYVSVIMNKNRQINATFVLATIPNKVLTTSVSGNGSVAPASGSYADGTYVQIIATPAQGSVFSAWSGDIDGAPPTGPAIVVIMNQDRHITAAFVPGTPTTASISGKITDLVTGAPAFEANVSIGSLLIQASISGDYQVSGLAPADYSIIVSKGGYVTLTKSIHAVAGSNTLNFTLAPLTTSIITTALQVVHGTYAAGDSIPFTLTLKYRGKAQSASIQMLIGHGLIGTFFTDIIMTAFPASMPLESDYVLQTIPETMVMPTGLDPDKEYSVDVTITTADGVKGTDRAYGAFHTVAGGGVSSTVISDVFFTIQSKPYNLGEEVPISLSYKYQGVAQDGTIQVILGKGVIFTQLYAFSSEDFPFAASSTLAVVNKDISIVLPNTLTLGDTLSVKIILTTADRKSADRAKGSQFSVGPGTAGQYPTAYRVVKDYTYPYGVEYNKDGAVTVNNAEEATMEINVPLSNLPSGDWLSQNAITVFESKLAEKGGHMLALKISEREHDALSMDYLIVATTSVPPAVAGQEITPKGIENVVYVVNPQVAFFAWVALALAILIAIGFILTIVVPSVRQVVWGKGGLVQKTVDTIGGIGSMMSSLILIMMMSMMMEMMNGMMAPAGAPPQPKPVTQFVISGAKAVGKGIVSGGKYLIKEYKASQEGEAA